MSNQLDMSLDDIIRNKGKSEGHSRDSRGKPRGSGSGPGPDRRGPTRFPLRNNPYPVAPPMYMPMPMQAPWQAPMVSSGGAEARLYISNLDYGVSNEDVKVLFSEVGELKRCSINYDRSGRSKGTAEVVFHKQADALAAIKRYNNVQLDGKPMQIELVGANVVMSVPAPPPFPPKSGFVRNPNVPFRSGREKFGGNAQARGGGSGPNAAGAGAGHRPARGRGHGSVRASKLSAEDLDAELDKYHLEATQIE